MGGACDKFLEERYPHQELTEKIIGTAIEVHRCLGPGFVEQIYENSLVVELHKRGHDVQKQINCDVRYQGELVGQHRLDLLVDSTVVVELKSVDALADIHTAQLRSTLKAAGKRIGLLMNFNQKTLTDGLRRAIN